MTSVLNHISDVLNNLCSGDVPMAGCWYGACQETKLENWNYFVFNRVRTATSSNRVDRETYYQVHIIHEDYIPEGYIDTVIKALEEPSEPGTKLKKTADDITYDYTFKGNSNMVVEIATITFVHPRKRSC